MILGLLWSQYSSNRAGLSSLPILAQVTQLEGHNGV